MVWLGTTPEFLSCVIMKKFTWLACNPRISLGVCEETVSLIALRAPSVSETVPNIGHPGAVTCD